MHVYRVCTPPSVAEPPYASYARARPIQVRKVAEDNGVDVSEQIKELEGRAAQV
jgi:hypothetical protein